MDRVVLVVGAVAVAGAVALLIDRRRPARPTRTGSALPALLDRRHFARPDASWLVAVFTAESCSTCAGVVARARPLESREVAVQELEVGREPQLHERYGIDAVPTLLVVDREGVVRSWFLGPVDPGELDTALTELGAGS